MNNPDATVGRKFVIYIACLLLALPILYAASSGPVLLIAAKKGDHNVTYGHVLGYFHPLLRLAKITHLEQPLSYYLGLWGIATVKFPWTPGPDDLMDIVPLHSYDRDTALPPPQS